MLHGALRRGTPRGIRARARASAFAFIYQGRERLVSVALITGSGGLIGSEAAIYFGSLGLDVVGIDNDMRQVFFGADGSTTWNRTRVQEILGKRYVHHDLDVRDRDAMLALFRRYGRAIELVIHTDFTVNANGTLNLLEATRNFCAEAPFVFTSTNKVYGDTPNRLPLRELEMRWEITPGHEYEPGISETMSIDYTKHSLFGASKVAADVLVQEYGRYFGMPTACFRGGCLTGPAHAGTELHGFLSYLMICTVTGRPYRVFGYKGKQVRDAIHSEDLIRAFHEFFKAPRVAEVYNIGGGRFSNASVIEAIRLSEEIAGVELAWTYSETNRIGDHIWWIGDNARFQSHYPDWQLDYDVPKILGEIYAVNQDRWRPPERRGTIRRS